MNKLRMKGTWDQVMGKLKQKFAVLTDDDLLFVQGKEEELLGKLEKKLGITKSKIRHLIESL